MPKAVTILSPFHNLSAGDLTDRLGALKAEIAALEAREKSLRDELIRRGVSECQGAAFSASVTQGIRWTLNTQTVKAEMGLPWYDARCGVSRAALTLPVTSTDAARAFRSAACCTLRANSSDSCCTVTVPEI